MHYLAVLFIFLVSGVIALGYQVLWSKYLLDFIGIGSYSYATILATFMAGLAIGSWSLGKLVDRVRSPLKMYGYLELAIGAYAIVYGPLSTAAASVYAKLVRFTPDHAGGTIGLGAKILVSSVLLLAPTILMGGTYPALLRHITRDLRGLGRKASQLYAINALGAVLGSLLMAFLLMPALGMRASLMLLSVSNTLIALIAFLLSGQKDSLARNEQADDSTSAAVPLNFYQLRIASILIFIEGVLAFVYEIGWTRYFSLTLGSSTYSFAIILAAFISGIAIGSAILSWMEGKLSNPLAFLGFTQVAAGLWVILTLPVYPFMPWLFSKYGELLSFDQKAFYLNEFGKVVLCYLLILPAAILIGMALPLVVKGLGRSVRSLGRDVGRIYAVNTWGNVAGALLSGLLLLPLLGMEILLRISAFCTIILGCIALICYLQRNILTKRVGLPVAICVAASILVTAFAGPWNPMWFTLFPFRRIPPTPGFADVQKMLAEEKMLLFRDDAAAHVIVKDGQGTRSLLINGKTDASSTIDMSTQILLAQLPMLLHPQAKEVLVVGLASGVTSGSVLMHPVQRLDVVEIVRTMPEAARLFLKWNNKPFQDPRFHLIVDDARSYLSYTSQKYDVVISEPSNPWTAGTGSLFSSDFYAKAKQKLRPDSLFLQWIHSYEMSDETFSIVLRSFRKHFPFIYAFQSSTDLFLIGCGQPLIVDWESARMRINDKRIREDLSRIQIPDLFTLLSAQIFSPPTVTVLASLTDRENTDDNHLLEYRAPIDLFCKSRVTFLDTYDERQTAPFSLLWREYSSRFPSDARFAEMLRQTRNGNLLPPGLRRHYSLAFYYMNGGALTPESLEIFPDSVLIQKPLSDSEVAETISRLILDKKATIAASLFKSVSRALLVASAFMPEKSEFWRLQTAEWTKLPLEQNLLSEIQEFRVDLLMQRGDASEAAKLVTELIGSNNPPPAEWAILRALQLKNKNLAILVLQMYSDSSQRDFVIRVSELF